MLLLQNLSTMTLEIIKMNISLKLINILFLFNDISNFSSFFSHHFHFNFFRTQ